MLDFESAYQRLLEDERTSKVELLTLRSAHPEGTSKEVKRSSPIHNTVDHVVLTKGRGVQGDRSYDGDRGPYVEDLAIMDIKVLHAIRIVLAHMGDGPLPGDNLLCDYPLDALRPGAVLWIGDALVEISPKAHTACDRFAARFGKDAARWVNKNRDRNLRGVKAVVLQSGVVKVGSAISEIKL